MTRPPINTSTLSAATLRRRVQTLETEVTHARAEAEAARDEAGRAKKERAGPFARVLATSGRAGVSVGDQ